MPMSDPITGTMVPVPLKRRNNIISVAIRWRGYFDHKVLILRDLLAVSVQADLVKSPSDLINDGAGIPRK